MEEFECKEKEALADISKVLKARRVAVMKMLDDGFEDRVKARKDQKVKTLGEKGLLNKNKCKRRTNMNNSSNT
ncbi:hypothetical protein BVRB_2g038020 [Beta vulgaris subsp. vulgaris]|nr:hypothetical protein BVRB_2g038020 [Beta vulgaris subsp. vulgaris]